MEKQERRRKGSSRPSSVVETKKESSKKPAKLVLKAPGPLSPPGEAGDVNIAPQSCDLCTPIMWLMMTFAPRPCD